MFTCYQNEACLKSFVKGNYGGERNCDHVEYSLKFYLMIHFVAPWPLLIIDLMNVYKLQVVTTKLVHVKSPKSSLIFELKAQSHPCIFTWSTNSPSCLQLIVLCLQCSCTFSPLPTFHLFFNVDFVYYCMKCLIISLYT